METTFFYVAVDTIVSELDKRLQNLGELKHNFGLLLIFPNSAKEELLQQFQTLSTALMKGS